MKGIVKAWKGNQGYGFIAPEGGADEVFVHYTNIISESRRKDLIEGGAVEFELAPGKEGKGPQAIEVRAV